MKIRCVSGYFIFEETRCGQVSDFISLTDLELVPQDRHYTFDALKDAPDYAIAGGTYLGAAVTKTFAGKPWEIMEANEIVYDFNTGLVVPIASITKTAMFDRAANYFLSPGLIIPGSITPQGLKVLSYAAWFYFESMKFRYSEVTYL